MSTDSLLRELGEPDVIVGGLSIWIQGREFPEANDYWDGNLKEKASRRYFNALDKRGSPTAYIFRCSRCNRIGGYTDSD